MKAKYEIINHGAENCQYFQGCGTSFTQFEHCVTGCGDNAKEAYEDAVESIYMNHDNADSLHLPTRPRGIRKSDCTTAEQSRNGEVYWYVSIRYSLDEEEAK